MVNNMQIEGGKKNYWRYNMLEKINKNEIGIYG